MGPVARRDVGGLASSEQIFAPPWKNVLDIVFGSLSIHSSPPLVSQSGLGLPIMLITVQQ